MKLRVGLLLAALLCCFALTGCPLMMLATGDYLIREVTTDLNNPDWLNDSTLIATNGLSSNLVELMAGSGSVRQIIDVGDSTIEKMSMPAVSPDGTKVILSASFAGLDKGDILIYDRGTGQLTNLTNNAEPVHAHGASWLSNSEVVYAVFDYSVTDQVTNRIIKHNVSTDVTDTVLDETFPSVGRDITDGEAYWWPKVAPGIDKILACRTTIVSSVETLTFMVLSFGGGELFDGTTVDTYATITGGDWIDENTVVFAAGAKGDISVYVVDLTTGNVTAEHSLANPQISYLYGLNLSPDKTLVASHAAEFNASEEFVANRLVVARIAAVP